MVITVREPHRGQVIVSRCASVCAVSLSASQLHLSMRIIAWEHVPRNLKPSHEHVTVTADGSRIVSLTIWCTPGRDDDGWMR